MQKTVIGAIVCAILVFAGKLFFRLCTHHSDAAYSSG
jgi:hypothetical protein